MSDPIRKTSEEWSKKYKKCFKILDPDGWDRKNFQYSWYEELITEEEFNRRVMFSTGMFSVEFLKGKMP